MMSVGFVASLRIWAAKMFVGQLKTGSWMIPQRKAHVLFLIHSNFLASSYAGYLLGKLNEEFRMRGSRLYFFDSYLGRHNVCRPAHPYMSTSISFSLLCQLSTSFLLQKPTGACYTREILFNSLGTILLTLSRSMIPCL